MGQIVKFGIFLLLCCFFIIPSQSFSFQWTKHIGASRQTWALSHIAPELLRRESSGEAAEKEKCPSRCEDKLRDVFTTDLEYHDVPQTGNGSFSTLQASNSTSQKDPHYWCYDKRYLASLYVCLQQHCTPTLAKKGSVDAGKKCVGGIPSEAVITENMDVQIVEIPNIEAPEGTKVVWLWTRMWMALTHNKRVRQEEARFNMILGWCIYGLAGTVLILAAVHHGLQRYRAKNIDFKASTHLEAMSSVSHKTRATVGLPKGTKAWTWIRKHFILPALFGQRHLEPIGWVTLPTRIQVLAVGAFIGVNTIFLVIDGRSTTVVDQAMQPGDVTRYLGDRAGFLSLANLPIIFLLGGRNNFLIGLTGLSYGVFNVFHKWVARVATVLAIIHSISYAVYMYQIGGASLVDKTKNVHYWWNGVGATITMSCIIILAILPFRRKMYELFLFLHIVGGILFLYFCFQHLRLSPDRVYNPWLWACIACWSFDRLARVWRIIRCNTRRGKFVKHNAKIKIIKETNIMKISIYPNKDGVGFFPGAHYFLYFGASWKFWQSHPFTAVDWRPKKALVNVNERARHVKRQERVRRIATATSMNDPARLGTAVSERLGTSASNAIGVYSPTTARPNPFVFPVNENDDSDEDWENRAVVDDDGDAGPAAEWAAGRAKITFLVRPHKGITQTVWNRIVDLSKKDLGKDKFGNRIIHPADVRGLSLSIPCFIEGPYGHQHSLHTFDTVVVIAGGIGVSTTLAYLYNHMARIEKRETFTRRFVFVWSCREDMLMDRLIWDADLINKTRDTSELYTTEIEMMLYFTGTATKQPEVKFVEPEVKEILEDKGGRRDRDRGVERRPSTGRPSTGQPSTGRPSTGRPSTGRQDSSSRNPTNPPQVYNPQSPPEKNSSSPENYSTPVHAPAGKGHKAEASLPKRSASKRTAHDAPEPTPVSHLKRTGSKRSPPEISEKPEAALKRHESGRSRRREEAADTGPSAPPQVNPEGPEPRPKPIRRESTRSNREKRRLERERGYPLETELQSYPPQPPPPQQPQPVPVRRPSTKSGHEKKKEEKDRDVDRERADRAHTTRPPLNPILGRPDIMEIIENENRILTGKMAVLVCGPDKMVDGTREAVVKSVGKDAVEGSRIQYFEEAFGW